MKQSKQQKRIQKLEEELEEERLRKELAAIEAEEYKDNDCYNPKKKMIVYWKSKVNRM